MSSSSHAASPSSVGSRRELVWGRRTLVMGILNVTPDSFFDGGRYDAAAAAVAQAQRLVAEGADWIDIGAESSRPGSQPISAEEEWRRLAPVMAPVAESCAVPVSVDTCKAVVARAALQAGATWVNDIWGLQGDPEMAAVVAEAGASVVIMHNHVGTDYADGVMGAMSRFFEISLRRAESVGITPDRIVLDPGIGFGKTPEQNLAVLQSLSQLRAFGLPVLLGASRKSVIGHVLGLPPAERLEGSLATTVAAVAAGLDVVRVHDVAAHVRTARMADAIYRISHG